MTAVTDMHSHILPGIDDGAKNIEETMQVLEEAVRQQVGAVIVTPHFYPGRYMTDAEQILQVLKAVQEQCRIRRLDIALYPGQECLYYSGLVKMLDSGRILTLANSRYVLVEFEPDVPYSYLLAGLRNLLSSGYRPILAHMERYACLQEKERLRELRMHGILLQMNFDMLIMKGGFFRRNPWRHLLQQGYVDYLGTDCHGMEFRPLHVREACEWLEHNLDDQSRERILRTNIRKIINNE